jgi:excisionase family DNA binding protein
MLTVVTHTTATPTLIDAAEAAKLTNVSVRHIYRLVERRVIDSVRVGAGNGPIRIPREPFVSWLLDESAGSRAPTTTSELKKERRQ